MKNNKAALTKRRLLVTREVVKTLRPSDRGYDTPEEQPDQASVRSNCVSGCGESLLPLLCNR
jgi:hypothetical protein